MEGRSRPLTEDERYFDVEGEGFGATAFTKAPERSVIESKKEFTTNGKPFPQIDAVSLMRLETDGGAIYNVSPNTQNESQSQPTTEKKTVFESHTASWYAEKAREIFLARKDT